jgi:GNAT superfamily N-acetyltransferase
MPGVRAAHEGPPNSPQQLCRSRVEFRLRLWNDNDLRPLKRRPLSANTGDLEMAAFDGVALSIVSTEAQLWRLLPLMRSYCDFYGVEPPDDALLLLSRSLMADPAHEGVQFIATEGVADLGFATLFWSWETTIAGRVGVMNDLFVAGASRGRGIGSALIAACLERCRHHGAVRMIWQTAVDNLAAQAVYAHVGATRESWVDYWLDTGAAGLLERH